jgi:hypothetical protein
MKTWVVMFIFLCAPSPAIAKPRQWQDATVTQIKSEDRGTQAAVIPLGNVLYGISVPVNSTFYWVKTEKFTYVIPNYARGGFASSPHVMLTGGEHYKVSIDDNNEHLHVIDDSGKDRKVRIMQRIANAPPKAVPEDH